jgi:voltage-gated potassium channel
LPWGLRNLNCCASVAQGKQGFEEPLLLERESLYALDIIDARRHAMKWQHWLGIAGISGRENARARRMAGYFDICSVMVALWIILVWYEETKGLLNAEQIRLYDSVIWLFFVIETVVLTWIVDDKLAYLKRNWLNLFIVVAGIPLLLGMRIYSFNIGALRLLLVFNLFLGLSTTARRILNRGRLGATLMVTLVFTMLAGLMLSTLDPGIKSPGDGIWLAWVTLTSVGYGDVVPTGITGRVMAVIVMIAGMGFSALLTANILALFMSEQEGKIVRYTEKELEEQLKTEERLKQLEKKIDQILEKIDKNR